MARKAKEAEQSAPKALSKQKFNKAMDEAIRQASNASEYNGHVGAVTKKFCDEYGISRKVFSQVRSLDKLEPAKQSAHLRDLLRLHHARGHFSQVDAFDDLVDVLREIVADLEKNDRTPARGEGDLDEVLG